MERTNSRFEEPHGKGSIGIFFTIEEILFSGKSPYQEILLFRNADLGLVLCLDGMVMTSEGDGFFYHEMLVHPALTIHPNPREVLVIGGGDGGTITELLRYQEVQKIVQVEIDELVVKVCRKYFQEFSRSFEDPRVRLHIQDGFSYLKDYDDKFDLIIVDGSDPVGPAKILFSSEFLALAKDHLKEEGIFVTQSGSPLYYQETLIPFLRELRSHCDTVELYLGPVPTYPSGFWSYILGSQGLSLVPRRYPPEGLKFYHPGLFPFPSRLPLFVKRYLPW